MQIIITIITTLILTIAVVDYLKHQRNQEIIAIDFDGLVDIQPILNRGIIYINNRQDVTLDEYFEAHVLEQEVIPSAILKAIKYQNLGYKLMFYSRRAENLRIQTAKVLNDWQLKGELYMNRNTLYPFLMAFKALNPKLKGIFDNNTDELKQVVKELEIDLIH